VCYASATATGERCSCSTERRRQAYAGAAPPLCAGPIEFRSLGFAGDAGLVGIFGFGAAPHIEFHRATCPGRQVYGFTRSADVEAQRFAPHLGPRRAGGSHAVLPEELEAAVIFAPAGALVSAASNPVRKRGVVVAG
jgi:alcohol dehydrogenase, propanol-preferring